MRSLWYATPLIIWFVAILYRFIEDDYEQEKKRRDRK